MPNEEELPPPPSMDQVLLEVERNRRDATRLLECIEQNTTRQHNELVTIHNFIRINPPTFCHSIEPLDVDDWLHNIEHSSTP